MNLALLSAVSRLRVRPSAGGGGGGNLRTFTSPEWAFLLGPQVVPGTYATAGMTNMEAAPASQWAGYQALMTELDGFVAQSGTVSVTQGSSTVTGSGTTFTGLAFRHIKIPDASHGSGYRFHRIRSVASDTELTLERYNHNSGNWEAHNWGGTTASGLAWEINNTTTGTGDNAPNAYMSAYAYYDAIFAGYQYWAHAYNMAEGTWIDNVRITADHLADCIPTMLMADTTTQGILDAPRQVPMMGWVCRALDEGAAFDHYWDTMDLFVTAQITPFLGRHAIGGSSPDGDFSPREGGYMLMYAAILGALHPNTTRRDYWRDQATNLAIDPVDRKADTGSWGSRWNFVFDANGPHLTLADGTTLAPAASLLLIGILVESLVWVHRMMRYRGTHLTRAADYAIIGDMIVEGVRHCWASYQQDSNVRGLSYLTGKSGDKRDGWRDLIVPDPPNDTGFATDPYVLTGNDFNDWGGIVVVRQRQADWIANIAYAHVLDPAGGWDTVWAEVMASCFEFQAASSNTFSSLWYSTNATRFNQHYRACLKGPGWMAGGLETF